VIDLRSPKTPVAVEVIDIGEAQAVFGELIGNERIQRQLITNKDSSRGVAGARRWHCQRSFWRQPGRDFISKVVFSFVAGSGAIFLNKKLRSYLSSVAIPAYE